MRHFVIRLDIQGFFSFTQRRDRNDRDHARVRYQEGRGEGVAEKPIPEPGPEEAIVRPTAAIIYVSDVHTVKGALPVSSDRRLGHESVGVRSAQYAVWPAGRAG
jgi:hypothetical protein